MTPQPMDLFMNSDNAQFTVAPSQVLSLIVCKEKSLGLITKGASHFQCMSEALHHLLMYIIISKLSACNNLYCLFNECQIYNFNTHLNNMTLR